MKIVIAPSQRRRGTITVIMLALIAIMCLFIIFNTQALYVLKRDISLVEKRQLQHWTNHPPQTATATAVTR